MPTARRNRRHDPFDLDLGGPDSCVIYLRLSQDRTGEGTAVERQEKESRALAARLGLVVDRVYRDNDFSATNGRTRPDFERMLADLADDPKPIVAWHQDRLLRLTSDLERVIALDLPVHFVASSDLDLATPAGRAVARTIAAWSAYEGEQKAARQRSSNKQSADNGRWQFSNRPYGYRRTDGKVVIVPEEADLIREGYRRYLAGESFYALANDWNARGITTYAGKAWSMTVVRRMLRNEHYAGLSAYLGRRVEPEQIEWEPLIDKATFHDFEVMVDERARPGGWSTRTKHLLSGLLVCGRCGARMLARPEKDRTGRPEKDRITYACHDNWCAVIAAEPVDEVVVGVVLDRLADPLVVRRLREAPDIAPLDEEIADVSRRRNAIVSMVADGLLDRRAARDQATRLTDRLESLRKRRAVLRSRSPLTDLALSRSVPKRWEALPLVDQRRVIVELGMTVYIDPLGRGHKGREIERIRVDWEPVADVADVEEVA